MIKRELEASPLPVGGAFIVRPKVFEDDRGVFSKLYTREILASIGAKPLFIEEYLSSSKMGALRGLHYQTGAHAQAKLVRCIRGKILDVFVDMRRSSPTFGRWHAVELSPAEGAPALYVPGTCAHGFLALEEGSEVIYKADNDYAPEHEAGIRWDDREVGIKWPAVELILSEKDRKWPAFRDAPKFA
jgi:dTDP-4-dehydrorhamnose 3,5-epimerase